MISFQKGVAMQKQLSMQSHVPRKVHKRSPSVASYPVSVDCQQQLCLRLIKVRSCDRLPHIKEEVRALLGLACPNRCAAGHQDIDGAIGGGAGRFQFIIAQQLWVLIGRVHPIKAPAFHFDDCFEVGNVSAQTQ